MSVFPESSPVILLPLNGVNVPYLIGFLHLLDGFKEAGFDCWSENFIVLSVEEFQGFNVETVEYKNISFTVWDVGGQDKVITTCGFSPFISTCCPVICWTFWCGHQSHFKATPLLCHIIQTFEKYLSALHPCSSSVVHSDVMLKSEHFGVDNFMRAFWMMLLMSWQSLNRFGHCGGTTSKIHRGWSLW